MAVQAASRGLGTLSMYTPWNRLAAHTVLGAPLPTSKGGARGTIIPLGRPLLCHPVIIVVVLLGGAAAVVAEAFIMVEAVLNN